MDVHDLQFWLNDEYRNLHLAMLLLQPSFAAIVNAVIGCAQDLLQYSMGLSPQEAIMHRFNTCLGAYKQLP